MKLAKNKITLIAVLPLIVGALITAAITINLFNQDMTSRLDNLRHELVAHIKHELTARVDTVYDIITTCHQQQRSEQDCLKSLGDIRFGENKSNYVWIHKLDVNDLDSAHLISHPRRSILGKNLAGYIDLDRVEKIYHKGEVKSRESVEDASVNSKKIFTIFNQVAVGSGSGFVSYFWPKSTEDSEFVIGYPKISYIKLFAPFSWVIGAGEYEDFIDELVERERAELLAQRNRIFLIFTFSFLLMLAALAGVSTLISKKVYRSLREYEKQILDTSDKLQLSEKRLYDIAANSGDIIWEVDTSGTYIFASGGAQVFGVDSAALIGTSMFDQVAENCREEFEQEIVALRQQKAAIENLESVFVGNDQKLHVQVNGVPVLGEDGSVVGYRGVLRDITRQKEEEEQQRKLERELQQANKMEAVGTLAAGIAHEINTPAQFVATNLEFLGESFAEVKDLIARFVLYLENEKELKGASSEIENLIQYIEEIDWEYLEGEIPLTIDQSKDGVQRISTIVTAMKEFSHPGGKEKSSLDIAKIIETTVTVSRNEWKYVADLSTHFQDDLPMISGYSDELGQVFLNLVVNAAHAIEAKIGRNPDGEKGRIDIRVETEQDFVAVHVSDNGTGIPEEVKSRVFDPFFTTKKVGKGTGQGLAIAHDVIAGKHGGAISLESEYGAGTTFTVRLPRK